MLGSLCIDLWVQDFKVLTRDSEPGREDVALLTRLHHVVLSTPGSGVCRDIAWHRDCSGRTRGGSRAGSGRRNIFLAWLIHTDLSTDCAVEVVAANVNPGVPGTKLDSADIVCSRHGATSITILNCVYFTLVLDAKRSLLWKFSTIRRQIVVHE